MSSLPQSCVILLTYKGKILLLNQEESATDTLFTNWHFIEGSGRKNKSFEDILIEEVTKKTGLQLESVTFISSIEYDHELKHFFHAKLTDKHVNDIERGEGQLIHFFTLKELSQISLTPLTKLFIARHQDLMTSSAVLN